MSPKFQRFLDEHGIKPEKAESEHCVESIGFSEKEQKWYGWSHRAIFGFGIGHTVKKGHVNYVADNPEELIDDHANFFADISQECADRKRAECAILPDRSGIRILHTPIELPMINEPGTFDVNETTADRLAKVLSGEIDCSDLPTVQLWKDNVTIQKCGRGEWTAQTLADCEEMAREFAKGVS